MKKKSQHEEHNMNNTEIKTPLNYKISKAVNPKNSPALVLLHGYGSNMLDLFALNQFFSENWTIISLQGPVPTAFGGFAWATSATTMSVSKRTISL